MKDGLYTYLRTVRVQGQRYFEGCVHDTYGHLGHDRRTRILRQDWQLARGDADVLMHELLSEENHTVA